MSLLREQGRLGAHRWWLSALVLSMLLVGLAASTGLAFTARARALGEGYMAVGTLDATPAGTLSGEVTVELVVTDVTGPLRANGGRVSGRYQLQVRLTGAAKADQPGAWEGTAEVTGTFTPTGAAPCALSGTGTFAGTGSEAAGSLALGATWGRVQCQGGDLMDPQELVLRLPPFVVDKPAATPPPATDAGGTTPPAGNQGTTPPPGVPGATVPPAGSQGATAPPTTPPPTTPATPPAGPALPAVPEGTPRGVDGVLELPMLRLVLGERLQDDKRGVQAGEKLPATATQVYLHLRFKETPPQGMMQVALYYQGRVKQRNLIPAAANDEFVITFYPTDAEAFPSGQWAVVAKAGDATLGLVPFTIGP